MLSILLAVGDKALENALRQRLEGEYNLIGITVYREGIIKNIVNKKPNIVIIKESLLGNTDFLEIILEIKTKFPEIRIIFIAGDKKEGDVFLSELVNLSVYDIIYGTQFSLDDIINLIKIPNKLSDVIHLKIKEVEVTYKIKKEEVIEEEKKDEKQEEIKKEEKKDKTNFTIKTKEILKKIIITPPKVKENETLKENKIYLFTSTKRGAGSTTLALNLAFFLANLNKKVLFLELNPLSPSVDHWLGFDKKINGLEDLLSGKGTTIRDTIVQTTKLMSSNSDMSSIYKGYPKGLDFLIFSQSYILKKEEVLDFERLNDLYFILLNQEDYDYIFVDTNLDMGYEIVKSNYLCSNKAIFVLEPDISSLGYFLSFMKELEDKSKVKIILNKHNEEIIKLKDIKEILEKDNIHVVQYNLDYPKGNYSAYPLVFKSKQIEKDIKGLINYIKKGV